MESNPSIVGAPQHANFDFIYTNIFTLSLWPRFSISFETFARGLPYTIHIIFNKLLTGLRTLTVWNKTSIFKNSEILSAAASWPYPIRCSMNQCTTSQNPTIEIKSYWTKVGVPLEYICSSWSKQYYPQFFFQNHASDRKNRQVGNVDINNDK